MNAFTTLSGKGQVVIPKDVRERLRLDIGDKLEVVERPDGVLLRKPVFSKSGRSFEEITDHIRRLVRYDGPPVSIDDMNATISEGWAEAARRGDARG